MSSLKQSSCCQALACNDCQRSMQDNSNACCFMCDSSSPKFHYSPLSSLELDKSQLCDRC